MRSQKTALVEVIDSFLLAQHSLSPKTIAVYGASLRNFARFVPGARLADLTLATVNAYIATKTRAGTPYAARNDAAVLKAFASWLDQASILSGPAGSVLRSVRTPRVPHDGRRPFSDDELRTIIRVTQQSPHAARDKALVLVIAGSGLRLNEAREFTCDDIDWSRRVLTIRSETSKSARTRETRLDPQAAAALDSYIRDWRQPVRGGPVFLGASGKPMTLNGFAHIFTRLARKLEEVGVEKFMAHRLRHTWATNYRRVGAGDIFDLQDEGGWKDLEMVRRYSHSRPMSERLRRPSPLNVLSGGRSA